MTCCNLCAWPAFVFLLNFNILKFLKIARPNVMIVELGHVQDESNINCKRKTFPIPWPHGGGQRCFKNDYKNLILYSHTYVINLHEVLFYILMVHLSEAGPILPSIAIYSKVLNLRKSTQLSQQWKINYMQKNDVYEAFYLNFDSHNPLVRGSDHFERSI